MQTPAADIQILHNPRTFSCTVYRNECVKNPCFCYSAHWFLHWYSKIKALCICSIEISVIIEVTLSFNGPQLMARHSQLKNVKVNLPSLCEKRSASQHNELRKSNVLNQMLCIHFFVHSWFSWCLASHVALRIGCNLYATCQFLFSLYDQLTNILWSLKFTCETEQEIAPSLLRLWGKQKETNAGILNKHEYQLHSANKSSELLIMKYWTSITKNLITLDNLECV